MKHRSFNRKELQAYEFIKTFILNKKYSPSFDEIVRNTEYSSKGGVFSLLKKLRNKGLIDYIDNQSRTITLPNSVIKIDRRKNILKGVIIDDLFYKN